MKFSIIVPTFNSESYLTNCLDHIKSLEYPTDLFELIIVDGGSTDNTINIAKTYGATIVNSLNTSVSNSRNMGALQASNDILVFIDSDCLINDQLLKACEKHLKDYSCTGSFYAPSDSHGWIAKTWLLSENKPSGEVNWLPAGTLLVVKDVFFEVGMFNEEYIADEDVEFCRRLRNAKYKIYNDKNVSSVHLGQSDDLKKFLEKEMWHSSSNLRYLKDYGVKGEKFSVLLNLYYLFTTFMLIASLLTFNAYYVVSAISTLFILSGVFSIIKTMKLKKKYSISRKLVILCQLYFLFAFYIFARYISIFKYKQFNVFFGK